MIVFLNGECSATIVSGIESFINLAIAYRRLLDFESESRKTLFKVVCSEEITIEEVQFLRKALRYKKACEEYKIMSIYIKENFGFE